MEKFEESLKKYAELALRVGVNIQPGQTLILSAPISSADFVRRIVSTAYDLGAKNVFVDWDDAETQRVKLEKAPTETLNEFPTWRAQGFLEMAKEGAAYLRVVATNPDVYKGIDTDRISAAARASAVAMREFSNYISTGKMSWSIVCVSTKEWAEKVFPGMDEGEAVEALWTLIFKATRVTEPNPVEAWQNHVDQLNQRLTYLNERQFKRLHYSAPGTDLRIDLPKHHIWVGGGITNLQGTYFVPNIPTEEVFTMPVKTGVNGTVQSTKPLNYNGTLIDNFSFTFENGRIVDFRAETGHDTLKSLIETDEGSLFLGEVALVPQNSPITEMDVVFYNTGFDENASCHLAIGNAYPLCIEGGVNMTKKELESHGANTSLKHVDFMIGSSDLNVDAENEDGTRVTLFRNGNWAI